MNRVILKFRGKYSFLSNFYPCKVEYEGLVYPSVENAYQASKTAPHRRREFLNISPKEAKRKGKKVPLLQGWESKKVDIMRELIWKKFSENEELKEILRELEVLGEDGKVREKTLLLGIHGVRDEIGYGMILGTRHGILCPTELRDRIKRKLELLLEAAEIDLNQNPIGCEVSGYQGHPFLEEVREKFGEKLNIVQLEISKTLRTRYTDQVITALSMVALPLR